MTLQAPSTAITIAGHVRFRDDELSGGGYNALLMKIYATSSPWLSYAIQQNAGTAFAYRFRLSAGAGGGLTSTANLTVLTGQTWYWLVATWQQGEVLRLRAFRSDDGTLLETVESASPSSLTIGYSTQPLRFGANESSTPPTAWADLAHWLVHDTVISDANLDAFRRGYVPLAPAADLWPIAGALNPDGTVPLEPGLVNGYDLTPNVSASVRVHGPHGADTTLPVVASVAHTAVTAASASVTWKTDELAAASVEIGTAPGVYDTTVVGSASATDVEHAVPVGDLAANTTYYYRAKATDLAGNVGYSVEQTFTTSAPDVDPPVISGVDASVGGTGTTATITWTTDEPSTSRVDYGTASGALGSSKTDGALVTSHTVELTGLTESTTYFYTVTSVDPSDNTATSAEGQFTTGSVPADWQTAWDTNDYATIRNWYLANTGIAGAGLVDGDLTASGTFQSSAAGEVIEGLLVTGSIIVKHDNVTVRNCKVVSGSDVIGIDVPFSARNDVNHFYVEYCTLVGDGSGGGATPTPNRGIGGSYATVHAHHVYVAGRAAGYRLGNDDGDELNFSMVENIRTYDGSHNTGVSFRGGRFKTITHNWIEGSSSSGISLYPDSLIQDVDCNFCLFDKGNYQVRGGDGNKAFADQLERIKFTDNKHTRDYVFGTRAAWSPHESNEWLRNVFLDNGDPA